MKRGDLLVVNIGQKLLYIGEVTLTPSEFGGFKNLNSAPILNHLNSEKFEAENKHIEEERPDKRKWVIINVKKFYDISFFNKEHKNQASGKQISQMPLVKELNEIYNYISKL